MQPEIPNNIGPKHLALNALEELKAHNIMDLKVTEITDITDHIVIASGTSTVHIKALADRVVDFIKKFTNQLVSIEGDKQTGWILIDVGDVIINIMLPEIRDFYKLEKLWSI